MPKTIEAFAAVATLSLALSLGGCASTDRPTPELIFASAALKAAERAQAERKSPDLFNRAQSALWKANRLFLAKEFGPAKTAAIDARRLAERAEFDAEMRAASSSGIPGE